MKKLVVIRMGADPEPHNAFGSFAPKRSVVDAHANRPQAGITSHLLEVERRVFGIRFKESKVSVGELLDLFGQFAVEVPKPRKRRVLHSGFAKPASISSSTSERRESSRPDSKSASICLSQS